MTWVVRERNWQFPFLKVDQIAFFYLIFFRKPNGQCSNIVCIELDFQIRCKITKNIWIFASFWATNRIITQKNRIKVRKFIWPFFDRFFYVFSVTCWFFNIWVECGARTHDGVAQNADVSTTWLPANKRVAIGWPAAQKRHNYSLSVNDLTSYLPNPTLPVEVRSSSFLL